MALVKRWLPWILLPLISCFAILVNRATQSSLLADTDTAVLLQTIRERKAPLSWFGGDWPLANHFYRPVSTLFFEVDNALYRDQAAGYGLTNALLACTCILLLSWAVREITDSGPWAGSASLLFGLWHTSPLWLQSATSVCWIFASVAIAGFFRGARLSAVLAFFTFVFLGTLFSPSMPFDYRIVAWLPGRTASVMTLFCLMSMAAYSRSIRLSTTISNAPTALDLPATKSTSQQSATSRQWVWITLSLLAGALALVSYEQAVMLPSVMTGLFVLAKLQGRKVPLWPVVAHWILLVVYAIVRASLVPQGVSGYQAQQFRNGQGVSLSLLDYALPAWNSASTLNLTLVGGALILFTAIPWLLASNIAGNVASWMGVWRDRSRWVILAFFALACLTYLPMAWLQQFGHYHYWPSAMRAAYTVGLCGVAGKLFLSAISPRAIQAPSRQNPAPGSLPRP